MQNNEQRLKELLSEYNIYELVKHTADEETQNIKLKQALNEIRKYINNKQIGEEHFGNEPYMFETKYGKDILKIIDKTLRGEN